MDTFLVYVTFNFFAFRKSSQGVTPVHITCFNGNIKLTCRLLRAGGDLRLHANEGQTAKDWAMMQPDAKKRSRMVEFLEKTRFHAMTHSGRDVLMERQPSNIHNR